MSKRFLITTLIICTLLVSSIGLANANMLVNGNFDDPLPSALTNGTWGVYDSITSWTKGAGTAGIEVQKSAVVTPDTPSYYIELDSHYGKVNNSSMYQTLYLDLGSYELSWMYHARTNNAGDDNGIKGFITATGTTNQVAYLGEISKTKNNMISTWENVIWTFDISAAGTYDLYFAAYGKDNTLGGFIDSAELNPVPEPATLILLGSGLAGLAFYRRKRK